MISFELPKKARALLTQLAESEGKSENEVALEALMERIEDFHDAQLLAAPAGEDEAENIPLEQIERELAELERAGRHAAE